MRVSGALRWPDVSQIGTNLVPSSAPPPTRDWVQRRSLTGTLRLGMILLYARTEEGRTHAEVLIESVLHV
jgi:uncharacterized protein YPO0396